MYQVKRIVKKAQAEGHSPFLQSFEGRSPTGRSPEEKGISERSPEGRGSTRRSLERRSATGKSHEGMVTFEEKGTARETLRQNCAETEDGGQLEYLTFPLLEETGAVSHLFSTRLGGVSQGDCATMNFSVDRGDSRENVLTNFGRIARVLGCEVDDMAASHQTHTTNIRRMTTDDRGKGILRERDYQDVDGMVTDVPGLVLVTFYADCVPLYFVDPVHKAIGLAHSGWRGTAGRMGERMVEAMGQQFGSRPEEIYAAIGPSICRDCYEVSEDVAEQFREMLGSQVAVPGAKAGKYQLDLWLANELILRQAGILQEHLAVTDICTCHNSEYLFSHRASKGRRGSLGAFLMLKA